MGRASTKPNKSEYQKAREKVGLTRKEAEKLVGINRDRLFKIENGNIKNIQPDEVTNMAKVYKCPALKNYYCSHDCRMGTEINIHKLKSENLSAIVLKMIDTLNILEEERVTFISICADGEISEGEQEEFERIRMELDSMEKSIETLALWTEEMKIKQNEKDN